MPLFFRQGLQGRPCAPTAAEQVTVPPAAPEVLPGAAADPGDDAGGPSARGTEAFYLVDNSQLQAPAEGLGPRLSKRLEDKDEQSCIPWGTRVCGCDEGDGWVRVDNWYLPMSLGGVPVLVEDQSVVRLRVCGLSGELCEVDADRSWSTRDLKREIERRTGIPWREQQLFADSAQLHEADELDALPGGRLADVTLVRVSRSPEQLSWLDRVEADGLVLRDAPQSIKGDYAIACAAVRQNGRALEFASEALRADRPLVQAALRADGAALGFAAGALRADRELRALARATRDSWLGRVKVSGMALGAAPATYRADKEIALAAVRQSGWALQFVAEGLKADREIVVTAVKGRGRALRHAAPHLLEDRDVVLAAVQASGHALELAAEPLKADREIVLAAARQDGSALAYADEDLRADREIVLTAVRQNSAALNLAGALWQDEEIRRAVAQQHGDSVSIRAHWGTGTTASAVAK